MLEAAIRIVAPPHKRAELLDVLHRLQGPTEVSRGCTACRVLQDADNLNAITYLVRWETQADLEAHLRTERFRTLLPYIELSGQPPDVEVFALESVGGIEFLVSVLSSAGNPTALPP